MELEYQYTREDFLDFNKAYCTYAFRKKLIFILILSFVVPLFAVNSKSLDIWYYFIVAFIILISLIILAYFLPLIRGSILTNKVLKNESHAFEKLKLTITDEGLYTESDTRNDTRLWESMVSINSISKFVYIKLADKRVLIFPDRFFTSHSERTNFLGIIQGKIGPLNQGLKPASYKKRKNPSIPWFIVSIVPIIGAVTGVILLADGRSRYKKKWYILLGFGGILLTISYVIILVRPINGFLAKQWAPFAQIDVNTLMKDVEFYKMKHGAYPDSLKQIEKDDKMAPIYDATVTIQFTDNKTVEYNYQKVGNHYYLFSSGPDGIKGTADDIYPQVSKSDSGKFGLIHK